jgi:sialic acid synthase SpsE
MGAHSYGNRDFEINGRRVGPGHPCYVIAEAGSNHNRDLETARLLIDAAAEAGADAVKFQTYTAEGLYSKRTPTASYLEMDGLVGEGESVWALIKRIEIPWEWHSELASHARDRGITFLSTPFEERAVDALQEVGMAAYKIASHEINHLPLIARAAATGKPLLLSTGMASLTDIERALDTAATAGAKDIMLLHCAINYPPRFEDLNLRAMATLSAAFGLPVGWSDHTMGSTADVAAVALGACCVEKHFTLSRNQPGPDHPFALEPAELGEMVSAVHATEAALGSPIQRATAAESEMYALGRRSLVASRDIPVGKPLELEDIAVKRPGTGIPVHEIGHLVGRRSVRPIEADAILSWDDLA